MTNQPQISKTEAGRALRITMRRFSYAYTLLSFSAAGYLFYTRLPEVTTVNSALAILIILLGGLPLFLYLYKAEVRHIPLLALNGVFYAIAFGFPVLSKEVAWQYVSAVSMYKALEYTAVGLVAMIGAYYLLSALVAYRQPYLRLPKGVKDRDLRIIAYLFLAVHLSYSFFPALKNVATLSQVALGSVWIGIGLLYFLLLSGRLRLWEKLVFYGGVLPVEMLLRLTTGQFYPIVTFVLFLALIRWHVLHRVPFTQLIIGIVAVVAIYPIKNEFRVVTWFSWKREVTYVEKVVIMYELLSKKYLQSTESVMEESRSQLSNRLSHIYVFSQVVDMTPLQVSFWDGGSYVFFLYSYIPRVLWPEKPESTIGNEFGHRYGFLDISDKETSWNLPWLIEFYANYGSIGVVIGMACIGLLFRFLVGVFSSPEITPVEYILGLTVIFPLYDAESNLALMWSGALTTFFAFYLILRLMLFHRK